MNIELFTRMSPILRCDLASIFYKIVNADDDLGATLRVHLIAEQIIDAWICAACNQEKLLKYKEGANETNINISFSNKLKMASSLNLPKPIFNALNSINKLRNKFAHDISHSTISISDIEINKLENILNDYTPDFRQLCNIQFMNQEPSFTVEYEKVTQNKEKLALIVAFIQYDLITLASRTTLEVRGYPLPENA